jgi:3-phenylpropionate/trans-cinnamate dioxygenase ferredoxin subunit
MAKHVIGPVASMPPGSQRRVEVDGRAIAVFNADGRFYALRDVCPHQGGPLSAGKVVGAVSSTMPGCYDYDPSRKRVRCPWHAWEYELATGQSWYDPENDRVRPIPVSVERGEEIVAEEGGLLRGPYTAETIEISVEDDYVVVEM